MSSVADGVPTPGWGAATAAGRAAPAPGSEGSRHSPMDVDAADQPEVDLAPAGAAGDTPATDANSKLSAGDEGAEMRGLTESGPGGSDEAAAQGAGGGADSKQLGAGACSEPVADQSGPGESDQPDTAKAELNAAELAQPDKPLDKDIALVTLDSDSDESGRPGPTGRTGARPPRACLNPDCKARQGLVSASSSDLVYFTMVHGEGAAVPAHLRVNGKRAKICTVCKMVVEKYNKLMAELVSQGRPLLEGAVRAKQNEVCLDSDGEDGPAGQQPVGDDDSASDSSELSLLEADGDMEERIRAAMSAVHFDHQLDTCIEWVRHKQAQIDDSFSKTERELSRLDKDLHYLYEDLYKERPPTRSLRPVTLCHTETQRTIHYSDGRVYDLDPAYTAHLQTTMPPPPPLAARPAGAPAHPATAAALKKQPANKPVGDIQISDVVQVRRAALPQDLPPLGTIQRPAVTVGQHVFAMHSDTLSPWFRATVREVVAKPSGARYKVKFDSPRVTSNKSRLAAGSELAYVGPSTVRLHVGVRVVGAFRHTQQQTPTFYSGTIAEAPKAMNGYRYLVFFDDGYAAYVQHRELKLICQPSNNAADDVHPECRQFVAKYLAQFPERPMVKLQPGQLVKTEYNGKWLPARVSEVDASLVLMVFESERHSEWIYRGSTRLAPMYAELVPVQPRKLGTGARRNIINTINLGKKNRVYVEYTRHAEREEEELGARRAAAPRAVARKSTAQSAAPSPPPPPPPTDRLISPISPMEGDGQIAEIANKPRVTPRRLQPHACGRACIRNYSDVDMDQLKGNNPLLMPMMSGWIREIVRHRTSKRTVLYRAPCGRRLRSLDEVFHFLSITGCRLEIDCFCFDFWVHCFTEFEPARKFCSIKDISYGKENVPVSCVNSLNRDYPDYVEYSTRRLPTDGVHLNLDADFLTCCDCTDDCQDKERCSCWQQTIQGTEFGPTGQLDPSAGYHFRRLVNGNVITGIYECNARCKCRRTCLNRVCQHPLRLRLQVFKTLRRGWGIRCLDDIPKGGFICVYAGQLLTESLANEDGKNYGDEYLAELDYIEVLERLKEGYESDVVDDDESGDEKRDEEKSDDETSPGGDDEDVAGTSSSETGRRRAGASRDADFVPRHGGGRGGGDTDLRRSNRARQTKTAGSEPQHETKKTSAAGAAKPPVESKRPASAPSAGRLSLPDDDYKSVREQFGADEYCYIMDAKNIGNLGRYLNLLAKRLRAERLCGHARPALPVGGLLRAVVRARRHGAYLGLQLRGGLRARQGDVLPLRQPGVPRPAAITDRAAVLPLRQPGVPRPAALTGRTATAAAGSAAAGCSNGLRYHCGSQECRGRLL
ncbi:histone-lysine N-methyltransferase eggless-like isoform X1 [Amphibalanus amphitrite]|uniref:histone-lysine N-methyltransferase eggless-like isoform X1 n=1 Tax=Amphibalanus amphitrite TaxID=1232801 RepID=UPI001C909AFA|nr:histone-lysine N-methyltransferase eggless-like isoform X1 [Amphibalanus amphitrite]XP_043220667.1 histone-lysine N-methyltransferase eggless-like isoform X1 [Amphibalanus amphitrite]